jgi:hypothetical protein
VPSVLTFQLREKKVQESDLPDDSHRANEQFIEIFRVGVTVGADVIGIGVNAIVVQILLEWFVGESVGFDVKQLVQMLLEMENQQMPEKRRQQALGARIVQTLQKRLIWIGIWTRQDIQQKNKLCTKIMFFNKLLFYHL